MNLLNDSSDSQYQDTVFDISDDIVLAAYIAGCASVIAYIETYMTKVPMHTNIQTGYEWVKYTLNGNEKKCHNVFRMSSHVFRQLCHTLRTRYGYDGTKRVCLEESVAMALVVLGNGMGNRMMQDRFQHSGETVHRHVSTVITLLATVMAPDIIKPDDPTFCTVPSHIQGSDRYWPHFMGCIGAIDGVHVPVLLPEKKQHPYRGRKGVTTVNCMCACDFDMKFTFACVGWEGSAHDTKIFLNCLNNERNNFPKAPPGKYYLVDSGYPMKPGFLAPYKGERYHIPDFQRGSQLHRSEERFNYLHSSLRSVIERTFGVWKNRWKILRCMPGFSIRTQNKIIVATMVLHNFIRIHDDNDVRHSRYARDTYTGSEGGHYDQVGDVVSYLDSDEMKEVRDYIIESICMDHN
ncbi:protein ALP1-like [Quercus lobata]|uniref:protein ALP1-like n=1 Tax=Quercus lobata TaxID=97700 RepID=UPI00124879B9|nr:protein ALP1-like [Quercus lobata]